MTELIYIRDGEGRRRGRRFGPFTLIEINDMVCTFFQCHIPMLLIIVWGSLNKSSFCFGTWCIMLLIYKPLHFAIASTTTLVFALFFSVLCTGNAVNTIYFDCVFLDLSHITCLSFLLMHLLYAGVTSCFSFTLLRIVYLLKPHFVNYLVRLICLSRHNNPINLSFINYVLFFFPQCHLIFNAYSWLAVFRTS